MTRPAREKRWVVREGDGATVADILARAKEEPSAVGEGRVFVGRQRVKRADHPVRAGDEVRIGAASPSAGARLIWERDGVIACEKPAGMPTVADHAGASHTLVAFAAAAAHRNVGELIITSRLDREVSGVVLFATAQSELRLRRAREESRYTRRYLALAPEKSLLALPSGVRFVSSDADQMRRNEPRTGEGGSEIAMGRRWEAAIGAGKDARHRAVDGANAKEAVTHYAVIARAGGVALLAVEPQTGRTHQIRVHAAHAGAPLLGDRDYGGSTRFTVAGGSVVSLSRIALHAARVTILGEDGLVATAPVPPELARIWVALGGDAEAWDTAASCELEV